MGPSEHHILRKCLGCYRRQPRATLTTQYKRPRRRNRRRSVKQQHKKPDKSALRPSLPDTTEDRRHQPASEGANGRGNRNVGRGTQLCSPRRGESCAGEERPREQGKEGENRTEKIQRHGSSNQLHSVLTSHDVSSCGQGTSHLWKRRGCRHGRQLCSTPHLVFCNKGNREN